VPADSVGYRTGSVDQGLNRCRQGRHVDRFGGVHPNQVPHSKRLIELFEQVIRQV
jgi:hypothetical protein